MHACAPLTLTRLPPRQACRRPPHSHSPASTTGMHAPRSLSLACLHKGSGLRDRRPDGDSAGSRQPHLPAAAAAAARRRLLLLLLLMAPLEGREALAQLLPLSIRVYFLQRMRCAFRGSR